VFPTNRPRMITRSTARWIDSSIDQASHFFKAVRMEHGMMFHQSGMRWTACSPRCSEFPSMPIIRLGGPLVKIEPPPPHPAARHLRSACATLRQRIVHPVQTGGIPNFPARKEHGSQHIGRTGWSHNNQNKLKSNFLQLIDLQVPRQSRAAFLSSIRNRSPEGGSH
jgi:hypothetical protein